MMTREEIAKEFVQTEKMMKAFVRYLVSNPQDAEDIFQDAAVVILGKEPEDIPEGVEFAKYCRGVIRNLARHYWSDKKKEAVRYMDELAESMELAYAEEDGNQDMWNRWHVALQRCLRKMGVASRQALRTHYGEGVRIVDMANSMRCSAGALRVKLHRIRETLVRCMRTVAEEEAHG